MKFNHYYILFKNHTDAMAMHRYLKGKGFDVKISPTPRELSLCCGVSLLISADEAEAVQKCLDTTELNYIEMQGLNNSFDNNRHKYC